jgi:hypothetical protein
MKRSWIFFAAILLGIGGLLTAFSHTAAQSVSTRQPAAEKTSAGKSGKLDMDKIFPPGPGRNLVLNDCTNCHTITPIVVVQMTREARERWARDHRQRVYAMTDEDYKILTEYLIKNFSPGKPIPQLPKELLDTWTSY